MYKLIFIFLIIIAVSTDAEAYLGPGVGGGIILAIFGIIIAVFAAIIGLIWFPVKKFFNNRKKEREKKNSID